MKLLRKPSHVPELDVIDVRGKAQQLASFLLLDDLSPKEIVRDHESVSVVCELINDGFDVIKLERGCISFNSLELFLDLVQIDKRVVGDDDLKNLAVDMFLLLDAESLLDLLDFFRPCFLSALQGVEEDELAEALLVHVLYQGLELGLFAGFVLLAGRLKVGLDGLEFEATRASVVEFMAANDLEFRFQLDEGEF